MEPRETHRCSAITAPAWRTVAGQDRGATRRYQAHPGADKVLLPGTKCRLYYRLVSKCGPGICNTSTGCRAIEIALGIHCHGRIGIRTVAAVLAGAEGIQ